MRSDPRAPDSDGDGIPDGRDGTPVTSATDGEEPLSAIAENPPDLVILDWMLPLVSGLEVCRQIRRKPDLRDIPIIMLTARGEEEDRIRGLDNGADDYISKPFSPSELLARVRAILRRTRPALSTEILRYDDLTMDIASHRVSRGSRQIHLGPTEFRLLRYLLEHPGRVFSREQDARTDGIRVAVVPQQPIGDIGRREVVVVLAVGRLVPERGNQPVPRLTAVRDLCVEERVEVDIEQARLVLCALDIAGHPVQRLGDAAQHQASTQVSFEPPPCDELTTSEPSRSATRVSPPGTTRTSLPNSTKGRRSMWRGASPSSTKVGQVESASVGWAM